MKKYFIRFMIVSLVIYSSVLTFIYMNQMDSIVIMKEGKIKPGTTFFIVDSHGTPVPNAGLGVESHSGWTYSVTDESGYSNHIIGEDIILSIAVNRKTIYDSEKNIFHWFNGLNSQSIFVIKYDP